MDEEQWKRLLNTNTTDASDTSETNLVNQLKCRQTFIKYKSTGRTYSRIYYLYLTGDAIYYIGSKHKSKYLACLLRDIDQVRRGFTCPTNVWKKCLAKKKITSDKENLAFSILYNNNRSSLDLLADSEAIRDQWVEGLEYLINQHRLDLRAYHEVTNQWLWYLFSQADSDNSGQLNHHEIKKLLDTLNIQLNEKEINLYFNQANIRKNNHEESKHLDKEEFLLFYKYVSYRPELLKIISQYNDSAPQTPTTGSDDHIVKTITKKISHANGDHFSPLNFHQPSKAKNIFDIDNKKNFLSGEQLKEFLEKEQHMKGITIDDSLKLIARFEPSSEGQKYGALSIDGFRLLLLHDEFCIMNPKKSFKIYQDMTRPLNDYFIATSHNTYIRDNQIYGHCTPETYIHALRTGCRAVEMDCYDGNDNEPVVYHGNTLTKPITFREIISAIETVAFSTSPYPVFLNIENHCHYEQQGIMAGILREAFKDHLICEPLMEEFDRLPSPEDLKYKVLVRTRRNPKRHSSIGETDPTKIDYHPDFAKLIIYSQTISHTPKMPTQKEKCFHSLSLKESKMDGLIEAPAPDHLNLIDLTKKHIIRVYPGTARQDSSNINPMSYWIYGVQMVALNYQSNDESMCLQRGFFSDNGGCGYILKPSFLLSDTHSFDPKERISQNGKQIYLHIISAQHLPKHKNQIEDTDIVDPYVEISTFGIPHDQTLHRTPSIRNNGLNPIWDYRIKLDIYCPDLCLIKFEVRDKDRYSSSDFLGQACVPFTAIQSGYRHIKLKGKNGDYIHGTLFVHIKIDNL